MVYRVKAGNGSIENGYKETVPHLHKNFGDVKLRKFIVINLLCSTMVRRFNVVIKL